MLILIRFVHPGTDRPISIKLKDGCSTKYLSDFVKNLMYGSFSNILLFSNENKLINILNVKFDYSAISQCRDLPNKEYN